MTEKPREIQAELHVVELKEKVNNSSLMKHHDDGLPSSAIRLGEQAGFPPASLSGDDKARPLFGRSRHSTKEKTMFFIIFLALLACTEVAAAQHKYVFPQFAFGGGWESTLVILTDTDLSPTTCAFSAQGRFLTMRDKGNNVHTGTELTIQEAFNLLRTETSDSEASSGMAVLDCDKRPLAAYTLFSLSIDGSLVGEALVEPSEEVVASESNSDFALATFPADHRDGARFAVALANPSNQALTARVSGIDVNNSELLVWTTVNVPENTAKAFFIDELGENPAGRVVGVSIWPDNHPGPSVYAIGLRVNGPVFTTIPAIVEPQPESSAEDISPPILWSHSGMGNTVFDKPYSVSRVEVTATYDGRGQNFIVRCGGRGMINTIIGTSRSLRNYSGIHNMSGCGEVEIVSSEGVRWSFTEVR